MTLKDKSLEPEITSELVEAHGINSDEYRKILDLLKREPSYTELGIFSAMWNEHCSYKSSKRWLRTFPSKGKQVICGPGENAGVVDIGDGLALAFKMESHNHPSYIEPFQGAATGMGGILRDIFTMGARPIAAMNSLSFGEPNHPKTKNLFNQVVAGIGSYGNCFGVPNVGGQLRFDKSYNGNCLVNAFAAGIVDSKKIFYSAASGINMPVVYIGAKTGRDGVGGATMASTVFDCEVEEKRPTVQVGDPFTEKKLMEACFELMETGAVISIQDMGAAGLTCSAVEMGDKGNLGIQLELEKVPVCDTNMTPYELMLSESQERMLLILRPELEDKAKKIFDKWDLDFAIVGKTLTDDKFIVRYNKVTKACLPLKALSGEAPVYDREWSAPKSKGTQIEVPEINPLNALETLIGSPNYCSRRPVWEQYDHTILSNTLIPPGSDASVIRVGKSNKGIAFTSDVTPRYCEANPYEGGKQAVAEAFRNLISVGAKPLAITDNLNFGNPENPKIMGQLVTCIKGIKDASLILGMPVVSGNVSLYNETDGVSIMPTPTIGAVGLIDNLEGKIDLHIQRGQRLILLGKTTGHLGQSALLHELGHKKLGDAPSVNLELELSLGKFVLEANQSGLLESVHDVSDGGIAIAAAKMSVKSNIGIELIEKDIAWYFGEDQARYLISANVEKINELKELASNSHLNILEVGIVSGDRFSLGKESIDLKSLKRLFESGLKNLLD